MTTIQVQLLRTLAARSSRSKSVINDGFTLTELLTVVMIAGILSVVALPQFMNQTKKAAATEGTQQASAIVKQASIYYLENGTISSGTDHSNCKDYAGLINTANTNFTYECDGTKDTFVVIAKGKSGHNKTDGVVVKMAADLTDGTVKKPIVSGI
ncbi:type IV pilin protein [Synechococcus sp. UW179A]|uniref:type IV pilin protein n=1 Tax=Synechococcus sp. UW179A TaxID=2575510 RepID=UPI000E0F6186|nr:prepilin-type N-terminal cleavage/methylation domain-containing protein [Synechococcus sp. UW179A]